MRFADALEAAGVATMSKTGNLHLRGRWGATAKDGTVVFTAWTDEPCEGGFQIWRPKYAFNGLWSEWRDGQIQPGLIAKLILLTPISSREKQPTRQIADATLAPFRVRIAKMNEKGAVVEPVSGNTLS